MRISKIANIDVVPDASAVGRRELESINGKRLIIPNGISESGHNIISTGISRCGKVASPNDVKVAQRDAIESTRMGNGA